jgi:hypothetical protein
VPQVRTLDELNARLEASCREDLKRQLRGQCQRKEYLLAEEVASRSHAPVAFCPI